MDDSTFARKLRKRFLSPAQMSLSISASSASSSSSNSNWRPSNCSRERFLSKYVPSGPSSSSKPNGGFRPFSSLAKLAYSTPPDLLPEGSTSVNPTDPARRTKMLAAKSLSLES
ncbi:GIY-YIG domain protein [Trichinella spiralis]|uniref:GIY-YIG domain protein n=1 Tax=Trichinella spiralis TaxID=6334 RepID=UPI0001EFC01C|nr:GIY-YIG domain protein [Trichinella spiralis]